jgi:hypothetical protein
MTLVERPKFRRKFRSAPTPSKPCPEVCGAGFFIRLTSRRTGGKKITFKLFKVGKMNENLAGGGAVTSALAYVFC